MMPKIEVKDLRIVEKGSLRAFCTVRFPESDLEFRDVRVIQQEGQKGFVVGPQREYEKDGIKKYIALVWWGKESKLGTLIQEVVLREYEAKRRSSSVGSMRREESTADIPF